MKLIAETNIGYIKKASEPKDFIDPFVEIGSHFGSLSHFNCPFAIETIANYFSNPTRFKECFVYFYFDKLNNPKSFIWWMKNYDPRINKKILLEYMWASLNPKFSIRIFNESFKHVNTLYKYDVISVGNITNCSKLNKFYKNKGFEEDSKPFYKKL